MQDVARLAEVGASTVSRYLRGGEYVSAAVAERVAQAVETLGYVPHELARGLRGNRTKTIGVVFPQIANSFFGRCVQMIESEATSQGFAVILLTHQESKVLQSKQLSTLKRFRVDGIVLTVAPGSDERLLRNELDGIPLVALDRPLWDEVDSVILDNRLAAQRATEHLIGHGHKKIACVTALPGMYTFVERIAGYRDAMQAAGLKECLIEADDYDGLRVSLGSALAKKDRPTALFSLSNMATSSALSAAREHSVLLGKDVAMLVFDDLDYATLLEYPLTAVRQPTEKLAHAAVQMLFRRIQDEPMIEDGMAADSSHHCLEGELILRRSCGCTG